MLTRHITGLRKAVDEASNGTKYLQTVSVVRCSRSVGGDPWKGVLLRFSGIIMIVFGNYNDCFWELLRLLW